MNTLIDLSNSLLYFYSFHVFYLFPAIQPLLPFFPLSFWSADCFNILQDSASNIQPCPHMRSAPCYPSKKRCSHFSVPHAYFYFTPCIMLSFFFYLHIYLLIFSKDNVLKQYLKNIKNSMHISLINQ